MSKTIARITTLPTALDFDACSFSRTNFQDVVDSCLLKEHNAAAFRTALIRLAHPRSHTEPSRETEFPPPQERRRSNHEHRSLCHIRGRSVDRSRRLELGLLHPGCRQTIRTNR